MIEPDHLSKLSRDLYKVESLMLNGLKDILASWQLYSLYKAIYYISIDKKTDIVMREQISR